MALVKCKECGHQISTEAKACPSCGAKPPKRTSPFTWFVALVFGIPLLIVLALSGQGPSSTAPASRVPEIPSLPPPPPHDEPWRAIVASVDKTDQRLVAEIKKMPWHSACVAWGNAGRANPNSRRTEALREYLLAESIINGIDLMNARERKIAVGMTACGVYAAFGLPDAANATTTANMTTREQLVYRARSMYVYTEGRAGDHNGIVRSFQN